jgi:simple sugar transport system permease protein
MNQLALLVGATLSAGTPLAIAGLGLLVNERSGVLNLGAEGLMLIGAVAGFAVAFHTGNVWLALGAAAAVTAAFAVAFGWLVIWLNTNQYATGLALSLFGGGFSAFVGTGYVGRKLADQGSHAIPLLGDLPFVGPALFRQHPMVYLTILLTAGVGWFLYRTRAGLVLRSIGESPDAAHALGHPVRTIRLLAVCVGAALCGISGAYLSVVYTPLWVEGMVAGRGWIALALTVFATWRPLRLLLGAYLFGGVTMLQLDLQARGVEIPSEFMTMLPYLATIAVLVLISRNAQWIRVNMPASLGKPFVPGNL